MDSITRLKKLVRKARLRGAFNTKEDPLALKAELAAQIKQHAVGGRIQVGYWQMDCDCASWEGGYKTQATVVHVKQVIDGLYENAEGPVRWWICDPREKIAPKSRDHALEAFEDGHAHSVTY
jgi:hypothetical protein